MESVASKKKGMCWSNSASTSVLHMAQEVCRYTCLSTYVPYRLPLYYTIRPYTLPPVFGLQAPVRRDTWQGCHPPDSLHIYHTGSLHRAAPPTLPGASSAAPASPLGPCESLHLEMIAWTETDMPPIVRVYLATQ